MFTGLGLTVDAKENDENGNESISILQVLLQLGITIVAEGTESN